MSRAISVKVATPKVIKALEARLAKLESDYSTQEANEAKYQKAVEKRQKALLDLAMANIKKAQNVRSSYRTWNKTLNVDFDLTFDESEVPVEPTRDFEQIGQHAYKEMKEDITNALSILKMTDEETVNATTMKSIARYL